MSVAGRIFRNTMWLTVGDKIGYILQFVFFLYFAKRFGVVPSGEYSFAFFFAYAFACFADFGATVYILREVARTQPKDRQLFFDCFVLRFLALLVITFAAIASLGLAGGASVQKLRLIACWGGYWIFYSLADLTLAELNGYGKSARVALLGIWLKLLSTTAGIGLIYLGINYDIVMVVFPVSSFIYLCTCIKVSVATIGPIPVRIESFSHYKQLLAILVPFFFLHFLWTCCPARTC